MALHTLNKSPFSSQVAVECVSILQSTDALILLEDGVYCGLIQSPIATLLADKIAAGLNVFYISADAQARGINHTLFTTIKPINFPKFVQLATEYKPVTSWF